MQNPNARAQAIQNRLNQAKQSAANLAETIIDKQTSDYLLRLAVNHLGDVERFLLPNAQKAETERNADMWFRAAENVLRMSEEQIGLVKKLTDQYGRDIRVVGI